VNLGRSAALGVQLTENAESTVDAVRIGPGQFLLDLEGLGADTVFAVEGRRFRVISTPEALTANNYLVTVREISGPDVGRQLTVQLRLGRPR
jgi:hypothetical protein